MSFRLSAPVAARRARFAARTMRRAKPFGFTLVELLVVISIIGALMAMLLPAIQNAFETSRQNSCKANVNNLVTALLAYEMDFKQYPGYMNFFKTESEKPYKMSPKGLQAQPVPVSWVIELLPRLGKNQQYDRMRRDFGDSGANGSSQNNNNTNQVTLQYDPREYVELFVCPSDSRPKTEGPMCYVVNSGQQDAQTATQASGGASSTSGNSTGGIPRDWKANGVFFDRYSEHPDVKQNGDMSLMVVMASTDVEDPHNLTIMVTENRDAKTYIFDPTRNGQTNYQYAEVEMGCTYAPGQSDTSHLQSSSGGGGGGVQSATQVPKMDPANGKKTLRPNVDGGKGDQMSYDFCRPSSKHPQMFVAGYVSKNVEMLKDTLSYFVFCKMMASNDAQMKYPGGQQPCDQYLRDFPLTEAHKQ